MDLTLQNVVGGIMSGLLALLWSDIRKIRLERESIVDMIQKNEDNAKLRALKVSKEIDETFLKEKTHSLICENASLRMERLVTESLSKAVSELKEEIRKNGRKAL